MRLGLVGHRISYSRSPEIHQRWMNHYHLKGAYEIYDCLEDSLVESLAQFDGCNVTTPFKAKIIPFIDGMTPLAEKIGAVNTIYKEQSLWIGDNTDAMALLEMMPETVRRLVVLGNGGAAKAVKAVGELRGQEVVCITREQWYDRHRLIDTADMLINATPIGLRGNGCPVDSLPNKDILVMDMVYEPQKTPLLSLACDRGYETLGGLEMLYRQARHSFHRWWGVLPELELASG